MRDESEQQQMVSYRNVVRNIIYEYAAALPPVRIKIAVETPNKY